jgi:nitrogenase molybdenum-iron protein alpha/beta subunit
MLHELEFANCENSKDPLTSCALEGVALVLAGINDVGVVIHSPQGCSATVANAYDMHEIDFTMRKVGCSRLFESDIIMGASEKLKKLIIDADAAYNTEVLFVVGTCAADIIGEDLEAVCRSLEGKVNSKLVSVMAGGFRGDAYNGINLGLETILKLMDKEPPDHTECDNEGKKVINFLVPQGSLNPTWWADAQWLKKIVQRLGGVAGTVLPRKATLSEVRNFGATGVNILLNHDVGFDFARQLEKRGTETIFEDMPLPVGIENTKNFLLRLGEYLGNVTAAREIIDHGEKMVVDLLRKRGLMIIPRYRNCRIAVSADFTIGVPLVRTLFKELEMIPELLLFRGDSKHGRALLEKELNELGISPKVVFNADGWKIKEALKSVKVDAVLGSAWEKYIAEELGIQFTFDLFYPTNRDIYIDREFFGYTGFLNILEVIANDWEHGLRSKHIAWEQYAS